MKRIHWIRIFYVVIFVLALAACGDDNEGEPPADQTPAVPTPDPTLDTDGDTVGMATIDMLQVAVLESFPVQVQATVSGNLSDACTSITAVDAQQSGQTFQIRIETGRDPEMVCAQALQPFSETIMLQTRGLPAATYTVVAGDLSQTFTLTTDNEAIDPAPDLAGATLMVDVVSAATPSAGNGVNEPVNGEFTRTYIYLIALEDAGQSGEMIGCNDSVVPVVVEIEPTIAPLTAALETLLSIKEQYYGQSGLYNALYQSDLSVEGVDIDNSQAIIHLTGNLQVGGACDSPRVQAQLEQTALQYETVDSVMITVNGEPLESLLSGQ